jgi:hypothetical protein
MHARAVLAWLAAAGVSAGVLGACVTAKGESYASTLARVGPPGGQARIVVLRPDERYDDASMSRIVIHIDGRVRGKLAYGGFLLTDVPPGELLLEASADNRLFGTCALVLRTAANDTLYFDAAPRPANTAAGVAGAVAGAMIPGGAAATAAGAVTGGAIASAAEGAGPGCKGPYRLTPLEPAVALAHLGRLRASE